MCVCVVVVVVKERRLLRSGLNIKSSPQSVAPVQIREQKKYLDKHVVRLQTVSLATSYITMLVYSSPNFHTSVYMSMNVMGLS